MGAWECSIRERVVPDPSKTLQGDAVAPFATRASRGWKRDLLLACRKHGIPVDVPYAKLGAEVRELIFEGDDDRWHGVQGYFDRLERRRYKVQNRVMIARYRRFDPCPDCGGARLRAEALAFRVAGADLGEISRLTLDGLAEWLDALELSEAEAARVGRLLERLQDRVATTRRVGLGYLALERQVRTLSGGEAQRIQLATALGGALTAALYVLDEPSIGLHARDVSRLLEVLREIRERGNTLVVVEHAPEFVAAADHVIDLGPGAGRHGGRLVAEGTVEELRAHPTAVTARALRGELEPRRRRSRSARGELVVEGASEHNLQNLDVTIPLGQLVVVTGVSARARARWSARCWWATCAASRSAAPARASAGRRRWGRWSWWIPIRRGAAPAPTPPPSPRRSTASAVASPPPARRRPAGWVPAGSRSTSRAAAATPARAGARPWWTCSSWRTCGFPARLALGTRYRREAQDIRVGGRCIVDVLALSIEEALEAFADDDAVVSRLEPLSRVGLGYLGLGQPLATLSGGEAQRLRLGLALAGREGRGSLFVLDEPTTGLHPAEVARLIESLDQLLDAGASVVVVEHNLDVVRAADHVIDLGPEGGPGGGRIVAQGPGSKIARVQKSLTGKALRGEF